MMVQPEMGHQKLFASTKLRMQARGSSRPHTPHPLHSACTAMRAGFTHDESQAMFDKIDVDRSGEVSFDEFKAWYVNQPRMNARVLKDADKESEDEDDP